MLDLYYTTFLALIGAGAIVAYLCSSYSTLAAIINRFILLAYDDNTTFLVSLFAMMRERFETRDYKYKLAIDLLICEQDIDLQGYKIISKYATATITDHGVLIQIRQVDENTLELLRLLSYHRVKQPLDMVIFSTTIQDLTQETLHAHKQIKLIIEKATNFIAPYALLIYGLEHIDYLSTFVSFTGDRILGWDSGICNGDLVSYIQDQVIQAQQTFLTTSDQQAQELILFVQGLLEYDIAPVAGHFDQVYFTGQVNGVNCYVEALFNKLFTATGLAHKREKSFITHNHKLLALQLFTISTTILLLCKLISNQTSLQVARSAIQPRVKVIRTLLDKYKNIKAINKTAHSYDCALLSAHMPDYQALFKPSMPLSYLSGLYYKHNKTVSNTIQTIAVKGIYALIDQEIDGLLHMPHVETTGLGIYNHFSYKKLQLFCSKLDRLYRIQQSLSVNANVNAALELYHGIQYNFPAHMTYDVQSINWRQDELVKCFVTNSRYLLDYLQSFNLGLTELLTDVNVKNIIQLKQQVMNIINWSESELLPQLQQRTFDLRFDIPKVLLGTELIDSFYQKLRDAFSAFTVKILSAHIPLVGQVILQDTGDNYYLNPAFKNLNHMLTLAKMHDGNPDSVKYLSCNPKILEQISEQLDNVHDQDWGRVMATVCRTVMFSHTHTSLNKAGLAGYFKLITDFANQYDRELYNALIDALVLSCAKELHALTSVLDKILVHVDQPIEQFCTEQINILKFELGKYANVFTLLNILDAHLPAWLKQLNFIYNQIYNPTDLKTLADLLGQTEKDPLHPKSFNTKSTFLAGKYTQLTKQMQTQYIDKLRKEFSQDFQQIQNLYNSKLSHTYPFTHTVQDALPADVIELYKQLDVLLQKYDVNWLQKYIDKGHLIFKLMKLDYLRYIADGSKELQLSISASNYQNELAQLSISGPDLFLDFRTQTKSTKIPSPLTLSAKFADGSKYKFHTGDHTMSIMLQGPWAIMRARKMTFPMMHGKRLVIEVKIAS